MQRNTIFELAILSVVLSVSSHVGVPVARAVEATSAVPIYIKLEAEDFGGYGQYRQGAGGWDFRMAWYPQWSRGGDSGWWASCIPSNATAGEVALDCDIPQAGAYTLWARYEDYLGQPEPFDVVVRHAGGESRTTFGVADVITAAQPPFSWSYAWDKKRVELKKGPAQIKIAVTTPARVRRAVDAIILTTDAKWVPMNRGFPPQAYAAYLAQWAEKRIPLLPLTGSNPPAAVTPKAWSLPLVAGRDFWYLGAGGFMSNFPLATCVQDTGDGTPDAVVKNYAARPTTIPVFGAPLCGLKVAIGEVGKLLQPADPVRQYILANRRPFVLGGNYASAGKVTNSYPALAAAFGDLWQGIISGEGSYLGLPLGPTNAALGPDFKVQNRAFLLTDGRQAWQNGLGADWASPIANPFEKFILCSSVGTFPYIHELAEAGAEVVGTESAGAMPYIQVQAAFARGAARQYGRKFLWYFGASFGDAIRSFTREPYFLDLEGLHVDNRNATVGPSLAHIRRTLLMAYLQGASFFYPEQGYNFFGPDGNLNPMGWPYDEMTRLATRHPDRGVIYTPVAVLLDCAHGWDKYNYVGSRIWDRQPMDRSDRMLKEFLDVAYFPFPRNEGDPVDDLNVPWPNGYFGDIFDVVVTSPTRTDAIKAYPVVFCVGNTRLDAKWAEALKGYVNAGGTLVINAEQIVPGLAADSFLGARLTRVQKEATRIECARDGVQLACSVFPYQVVEPAGSEVIATTETGDPAALVSKVGKGRVVLTTPSYLLGRDAVALPYLPHLLLELTSGLMPVQVRGNCEYAVNLHPRGYVVTLSNNEGLVKPSHAPARLDMNRTVTVELTLAEKPVKTEDWLGEEPQTWSYPAEWLPEYTQPVKVKWEQAGNAWRAAVKLLPGEMRVFHIQTR